MFGTRKCCAPKSASVWIVVRMFAMPLVTGSGPPGEPGTHAREASRLVEIEDVVWEQPHHEERGRGVEDRLLRGERLQLPRRSVLPEGRLDHVRIDGRTEL